MIADIKSESCPYSDERNPDGHGGVKTGPHDLRNIGIGFLVCNQCRVVFVPATVQS